LGVTGSGKTFTVANVIERVNRPTLVLAHNKTLAAQLCSEFREFFPDNAVEYFVSYYDYYQPEAYIASTDTYIEKDSAINDEIERLRHSATARSAREGTSSSWRPSRASIRWATRLIIKTWSFRCERRPARPRRIAFKARRTSVRAKRHQLCAKQIRVRGDSVEVSPSYYTDTAIRIELFGDEIDRIWEINVLTGEVKNIVTHAAIYPASHYIVPLEKMAAAIEDIRRECDERVRFFREHDKFIEAQRIAERTNYDMEMLTEIGFCKGIENYSRVLSRRAPGSMPFTLLDYFPDDFLFVVDESHVTLPQAHGMLPGDRARKQSLIDFGFRLPSALDNRPLSFEELYGQSTRLSSSAPRRRLSVKKSSQVVEQLIRRRPFGPDRRRAACRGAN
jgi:excinuclease ABC subunit B